jgi:hypothetical protein
MEATPMSESLWIVGASTPAMALRYAAAFFLVVVGIGLIYALVRLGGTLRSAEKLMTDVDTEVVPLLKQATVTLDGVNTELDKVGVVMSSVVDATEKVDQTTRMVESAITVPAKKAAAFGAGVSQAVSSFFNRGAEAPEPEPGEGAPSGASWSPPSGYADSAPMADAARSAGAPTAEAAAGAAAAQTPADAPASAADEPVADVASATPAPEAPEPATPEPATGPSEGSGG